jgi:hypothetical protein
MSKQELYKTAKATIGCALFPADTFVSVKFSHTANGVDWYEIRRTESGPLNGFVMYPAHHLTNFVL